MALTGVAYLVLRDRCVNDVAPEKE